MQFPSDVKFSVYTRSFELPLSSMYIRISYQLDIISESRYHLHLITDVRTRTSVVRAQRKSVLITCALLNLKISIIIVRPTGFL